MLANLKKPNDQSSKTPKKTKNVKSKGKSTQEEKNDKAPPFASQPGKEGDTKEFNEKTYYYCSGEHKVGHWVTHKPEKCRAKQKKPANGKKKTGSNKDKRVVVDSDKLRAAVSVLAQSAGQDAEAINTSLMAAIAPDSDDSSQE